MDSLQKLVCEKRFNFIIMKEYTKKNRRIKLILLKDIKIPV